MEYFCVGKSQDYIRRVAKKGSPVEYCRPREKLEQICGLEAREYCPQHVFVRSSEKDRADLECNKTFDQKIKTLVIDTMSQRDQNNINKVTNDRTVTASNAPMEDALDRMFENVE